MKRIFMVIVLTLLVFQPPNTLAFNTGDEGLGPHSDRAKGELRVLAVAVRFPDANPSFELNNIRKRAVDNLDQYVREQSYDQAWLKADFRGWVDLPDSLSKYKVSPHNYKVDRSRVRKLIEDTLTGLGNDVDFSRYKHMLVIPGVRTMPGEGYGMLCYCANPGMLTGVKGKLAYATVRSRSGREFSGGIFVGAENAHLGMFAHDFFHALGGIEGGKRLVPCLYDYDRQSDVSRLPSFDHNAIYIGPWDIMSQHFLERGGLPPGLTSFTKIRLGWITREQVRFVKRGETAAAFLSPLSTGGETLAIKIPLSRGKYYLVENRQPAGFDRALPDSGILVLKVDPDAQEGSGTVKIMDATPGSAHFRQATFRPDDASRRLFKDGDVAVIPLWKEGDRLGVIVTTPEKSAETLEAARAVAAMEKTRGPQNSLTGEAKAAFMTFDFKRCVELAKR